MQNQNDTLRLNNHLITFDLLIKLARNRKPSEIERIIKKAKEAQKKTHRQTKTIKRGCSSMVEQGL